jgi:hypothetical protein
MMTAVSPQASHRLLERQYADNIPPKVFIDETGIGFGWPFLFRFSGCKRLISAPVLIDLTWLLYRSGRPATHGLSIRDETACLAIVF